MPLLRLRIRGTLSFCRCGIGGHLPRLPRHRGGTRHVGFRFCQQGEKWRDLAFFIIGPFLWNMRKPCLQPLSLMPSV